MRAGVARDAARAPAPVGSGRAEPVRPLPRLGHDLARLPVHPPSAVVVHRCGDHPCAGSCPQPEETVSRQVIDAPGAVPGPSLRGPDLPGRDLPGSDLPGPGLPAARVLPQAITDVLAGGGRPLPAAVRADMEASFAAAAPTFSPAPLTLHASSVLSAPGDPAERQAEQVAAQVAGQVAGGPPVAAPGPAPDFSGVRIHTDGQAARSAAAVAAAAYSVGRHIVFGAGRYDPEGAAGRRLLAHELTHVLQQPHAAGVVHRQNCGHDSATQGPRCGGHRWKLTDVGDAEGAGVWQALDHRIVTSGLQPTFGGRWVTEVRTPKNPAKPGTDFGRVDGLRVQVGRTLRVEVVEVKSRRISPDGGCAVATKQANGYVAVLNGLRQHIVAISRALSARPALRRAGDAPSAETRRALAAAGVDLALPPVREAWSFLRSLERALGTGVLTGFTDFEAVLFGGGVAGFTYVVSPPIAVPCKVGGRSGITARWLTYQVNNAGGASYNCVDSGCTADVEKEIRTPSVPVELTGHRPKVISIAERKANEDTDERDLPGGSDYTVPIVVVGAAAAAAARKRAQQAAARRLAAEAAKRAELEAIRRAELAAFRQLAAAGTEEATAATVTSLGARRAAGSAAGKAIAAAAVAAALVLVVTGEAKAEPGPGKSSLEALYDVMTRNGAPPSPEMRQFIEEDPALRALAERAAERNDPSELQHELDRRSLEYLREHAAEFSDEQLDLLLRSASARGARSAPPEIDELKRRVAREQQRRRAGQAGRSGKAGGDGDRPPHLSERAAAELRAASGPRRTVVEAILRQRGAGPAFDDAAVHRLLDAVPADLRPDEADRLAGAVGPAAGRPIDDVVAALGRAVAELRKQASTDPSSDTGQGGQAGGAAGPDYVASMQRVIAGFRSWDRIPLFGSWLWATGAGQHLPSAPVGARLDVQVVAKLRPGSTPVRAAGAGPATVVSRSRTEVRVMMLGQLVTVLEDGRSFAMPPRYTITAPLGGHR